MRLLLKNMAVAPFIHTLPASWLKTEGSRGLPDKGNLTEFWNHIGNHMAARLDIPPAGDSREHNRCP